MMVENLQAVSGLSSWASNLSTVPHYGVISILQRLTAQRTSISASKSFKEEYKTSVCMCVQFNIEMKGTWESRVVEHKIWLMDEE